jgi:uncharacterized protein YqgC (DUF456 family)
MNIDPFLQLIVETFTFFVLLIGLAGLLVPIFPGLTVMWLGTVFYALVETAAQKMTGWDWALFIFITMLMLVGNVVDNIIIARKMRDRYIPWRSIIFAYVAGIIASLFFTPLVGLFASPAALLVTEYFRLRSRRKAFASTKAWLIGWGWSFAARFSIGVLITGLWMIWAWVKF